MVELEALGIENWLRTDTQALSTESAFPDRQIDPGNSGDKPDYGGGTSLGASIASGALFKRRWRDARRQDRQARNLALEEGPTRQWVRVHGPPQ
ncbi:hypothetical protein ASC90_03650 [Rhizobium sp. Root1220]|nr:hypothetical protein ASC90_03650 [Rhizobium sp. Root1220]